MLYTYVMFIANFAPPPSSAVLITGMILPVVLVICFLAELVTCLYLRRRDRRPLVVACWTIANGFSTGVLLLLSLTNLEDPVTKVLYNLVESLPQRWIFVGLYGAYALISLAAATLLECLVWVPLARRWRLSNPIRTVLISNGISHLLWFVLVVALG